MPSSTDGAAFDIDSRAAEWERTERAAIAAEASGQAQLPDGWLGAGEVLAASPLPKARLRTGIPALDAASRGGFPTGAIVTFQGEPDAGKTGIALQVVLNIAQENEVFVVLFTPDGGREAAAIRIGALLGLNSERLEQRDLAEVGLLTKSLEGRRIFLPDHAREDVTLDRVIADAERLWPDMPHVYVVDSIQEARSTEGAEDLDERRRVNLTMRGLQKATTGSVPTLVLACSQTAKSSFAATKTQDRTRPIAAGAESGKIAFLSSMLVHLDGDPSRGPEWGRARVVKSKLGGGKPTFTLRLDPATTRLQEIDGIEATREREESAMRERGKALGKLGDQALALLVKEGPLNVSALLDRISAKKADLLGALDGLAAQKAAVWKPGPKNSHVWEAVRG